MRLDEAIYAHLIANAGVSALVGSRIWKNKTPQKPVYPAIRYFRAAGSESYSHDGATNWPVVTIQIDCMDHSDAKAHQVAEALRNAMDGFVTPGVMGGASGVRVDEIIVGGSTDGWDDDLEVAVVSVDVEISHER